MQIIIEDNNRVLVKNNEKIIVNNGSIIEYTGIYYKIINDIIKMVEIETTFIGEVECEKSKFDTIEGIYIKPLYIWDKNNNEWKKIINYTPPIDKYFYYPHLLMLSDIYYHNLPLYYLHTCKNRSLNEFKNITKTFNY